MSNQLRNIPFRHPQVGVFFQAQPKLENPYLGDGFLQRILQRLIPEKEAYQEIHQDLSQFGERICKEIDGLGAECERNQPYLRQYDPWGNRIDEIVTCEAWKRLKIVSAEENLIGLGYNSKHGRLYGRLHQYTKLFMFSPASGLFSCPLAMTDGAAKSIQALNYAPLMNAYEKLTTSDPTNFWTSGQWMTEKRGGSDVAIGTETIAVPESDADDRKYKLFGYKWFSSATDSDMSLTLARIAEQDGNVTSGSRGLSMFFVKTRNADGSLNNIHVMKLKNKLGTRQLPTGELLLDGTQAELVSEKGRGVASISNMLTITRIHNGVASTGYMRRIVSLARDYSKRRACFGNLIYQYPLHLDTLAALELETRACTSLVFEMVRLLGLTEAQSNNEEAQLLLRLLSPIMKLYTGKKCVPLISEGLECIGGQGYIEDTGIPVILRDAQVTPIWEGTTNILSLDVLRAIEKSKGEVLKAWNSDIAKRLSKANTARPELGQSIAKVSKELDQLRKLVGSNLINEKSARLLSFSLAEVTIGMLLIEQAAGSTASKSDMITATRWATQMSDIQERFKKFYPDSEITKDDSNELVFDSYNES